MNSFGPVIFFCTIILGALLIYEKKKDARLQSDADTRFWSREAASNMVRKKDISFLAYITIPVQELPFAETANMDLKEYQSIIKNLATQKILNLSEFSNTDLKLEYGPANLPLLAEYDTNYNTLVNTIAKWGQTLYEIGNVTDAVTVLEYGVSIGTDISRNLYILADIYRTNNQPEEIDRLISYADNIKTLLKPSIITKLKEIRSYCK